jgi:hypothetical protein
MESTWKIAGQRNAAVEAIQRRPAALAVRRNLSEWRRFSGSWLYHSQFALIRVNSRLERFQSSCTRQIAFLILPCTLFPMERHV